jgi:Flp pilus assembly protein TadB
MGVAPTLARAMEPRFVSLRATHVDPSRLQAVCSRYAAYERVRMVRHVLIRRLLLILLAIGVLTLGIHALPFMALITAAALAAACLGLMLQLEVKARRRFTDEMRDTS